MVRGRQGQFSREVGARNRDAIVAWLEEQDVPATIPQIAAAVGLSVKSVRPILRLLESDERVINLGRRAVQTAAPSLWVAA